MTRFGLDSTAQVPTSAHHAVGSTVALRYLSRSSWKVVTGSEHQAYRQGGIDLCLVFEDDGRPDQHGYDGGKADAEFALNQATAILGKPRLPPCITFAADYDPAGNAAATDAYYDGVAAVMGRDRAGPYGGFEVVARQYNRGFRSLWQTYAWSGGQFWSKAQLYQYSNDHTVGGVGVDFNHVYGVDFGQWDRQPPAPVDPQHYAWFATGPFPFYGKSLNERAIVEEYDRLRATQTWTRHPHRARLAVLRQQLEFLAKRVAYLAHKDHPNVSVGRALALEAGAPTYRGWRFQQLARRAQGQRMVPKP